MAGPNGIYGVTAHQPYPQVLDNIGSTYSSVNPAMYNGYTSDWTQGIQPYTVDWGQASSGGSGMLGMASTALGMANPMFAVGTGILGALNTAIGIAGLNSMGAPPEFTAGQELTNSYNRAEGMTGYGLTPEEYGQAQDSITRSNNTAYRKAVNMSGGNLAQAVSGAVNAQNLRANNELAAIDAAQRRDNIRYADSLGSQMQRIQEMNTAQEIDQYNRKQQAYGGAMQAGLTNLANFTNLRGIMPR